MKLTTLLFLVGSLGWALPPDFSANYHFTNRPGDPVDNVISFNAPGSTNPLNNSAIGCVGFSFTYNSEGFTVISINLQTSPKFLGGQSSGTWSTYGGTSTSGTLPLTGTSQGTYIGYGYYPFFRINLATATGTGSIDVQFQCWKSISYASTLGVGGNATVDATSIANATMLTITGTDTVYTGTNAHCPAALVNGQVFSGYIPITNSANVAPPLNICTLGNLTIVHNGGTPLYLSELDASGLRPCGFQYNGVNLLLIPGTCSTGGSVLSLTPILTSTVQTPGSGQLNAFLPSDNSNLLRTIDSSRTITDYSPVLSLSTANKGYWTPIYSSGGTVTIGSANVVRCINITPRSVFVRRIGLRITAAAASKGDAIGLYDINTGNVLSQATSVAVTGGGIPFTLAAAVQVYDGIAYTICYASEDSSFQFFRLADSSLFDMLNVTPDVQMFTATQAGGATSITGTNGTYALPTTLGAHVQASFDFPWFILLP